MATSSLETESRSGTDSQSQISEALARHRGLILFALKKFLRAKPDLNDDILAVARAALVRALETYRTDSGVAFSTFAVHRVRWDVSGFLSRFCRKDTSTASLDEALGQTDDGIFTLADVVDAQAAAVEQSAGIADEILLRRIHDLREAITACRMTRRERIVVHKFLDGVNPEKIAVELDVTPQRVSQAMTSVVRKLRRHLKLSGLPSSHDLAITD